ncbi:MAG: hypothetical protein CMJ70_07510 [Planctomycetaceae bacterium]|nr:hypothetical protein [Planctomycetaceae bacterium]HAA67777.1 hypothetical protein [Planctomycetaceae bacterium]
MLTARRLPTRLFTTTSLSLLLLATQIGSAQQAVPANRATGKTKKKAAAPVPAIPLSLFFGNDTPPPKRKPANGYEEILFEYLRANYELLTKMRAAKTPPERRAILEQRPQPKTYGKRFLEYARQHPKEKTALDALAWTAGHVRIDQTLDDAVDLLIKLHLQDPRITEAISTGPGVSPSAARQRLLTAMLAKSPHPQVRSAACIRLARIHVYTARISPQVQASPERYVRVYGQDTVEMIQRSGNANELKSKAEDLFARALKESSDLPTLLSVVEQSTGGSRIDALNVLIQDHAEESDFVERIRSVTLRASHSDSNERVLRTLLKANLSPAVQGPALLGLAKLLHSQATLSRRLRGASKAQRARYNRSYGASYVDRIAKLEPDPVVAAATTVLERVISTYADVNGEVTLNGRTLMSGTLGDQAKPILNEITQLSVGNVAPEITAEDLEGVPFKLSDYRGKVVMLDFWGHW